MRFFEICYVEIWERIWDILGYDPIFKKSAQRILLLRTFDLEKGNHYLDFLELEESFLFVDEALPVDLFDEFFSSSSLVCVCVRPFLSLMSSILFFLLS